MTTHPGDGSSTVQPSAADARAPERAILRRIRPAGVVGAAAGLVLFVYFVREGGPTEILAGLRRLGLGFLLILALSAVRELARTVAWIRCVEGWPRLPFGPALRARLMGEALGNLTPFSLVLSEPAKAVLVKDRVPLLAALSGIAIEDVLYSLSAAFMIVAGMTAFLWSFDVPYALRLAGLAAAAGVTTIMALTLWVLSRRLRLLSGGLEWLTRRGVGGRLLRDRTAHVRALEDRVYGFGTRNQGRLLATFGLEALFHTAAVAEVYVTLALIGAAPTLLTAFILESVDRLIIIAFKFIPLRVGVDEAGTGLVAAVLGFGTAAGVTLAIVRKARVVWWTAVGVALLVGRGLSVKAVAREAAVALGDGPGT